MEPILVVTVEDIQRLFDDVPNISVDVNSCQIIDIDSIIQNSPILETSHPFNAGTYEWNVRIVHY